MAQCVGKLVGEVFNTDPIAGVLKWKDPCYWELSEFERQIIQAVYNTNKGQFLKISSVQRGNSGNHSNRRAVDFSVRFSKDLPLLYYTYVDLIKSGWGGAVLLASRKLSRGRQPQLHLHVDVRYVDQKIGRLYGFEVADGGVLRDSPKRRAVVRKEYGANSDTPPGFFDSFGGALQAIQFASVAYILSKLFSDD